MTYRLDEVVPWGRSLAEYQAMFDLSNLDRITKVLGCGDGPASFNAEGTAAGLDITSIDPLYAFGAEQIASRIDDVFDTVMGQARENHHEFVWGSPIRDLNDLAETRSGAMHRFLDDYPEGRSTGRYRPGSLPSLDLEDRRFDLALCSHYLFLYSEHVSLPEHVASLRELRRVATEVRVFPLLELGGAPSRHLEAVEAALAADGLVTERRTVDYEFQRGGNTLLVIR